jgi:phosphoribosyl-AMP cyclohydrolase
VIAQEQGTGDVLMFAWMNREALQKTAELGRAVYFSRSRGKLWFKGEESGPCADGARNPHGLRQRRGAAEGHAARARARHRLPHRAPQLFLQRAEGRRLDITEPVLKDPESIYK